MSRKLAMTPTIKTSNLSKPEKVACPKCDASLVFYRGEKPHIDQCGFESYSLKCRACGAMLIGIIDPADDSITCDDFVVGRNLRRGRSECAPWAASPEFLPTINRSLVERLFQWIY